MEKFNSYQAKQEITQIFNEVSFRKFGNAFRKHVNPYFKAEYNTTAVGGRVCATFPWSELASYIIGDGSYSITEDQYRAFMAQIKNK